MRWLGLTGALRALCALTAAASVYAAAPGFSTSTIARSSGQKAECLVGLVSVSVTSNNTRLLFPEPEDQLAVTGAIVEYVQVNPPLPATIIGGPNVVSGDYSIFSKLCLSVNRRPVAVQTLQFLTHGDTLSSSYWDIAPGYSQVDAAAEAGYATFSYDKIGVGKSDHPDPLQVVQAQLSVEIAHLLVQSLRQGRLGGQSFAKIVGVGHSAGSSITSAVSGKYPADFDAVVVSGTSTLVNYVATGVAAFSLEIASNDASRRFRGLPNAYLVQATSQSIELPYYRYPNFDPNVFEYQVADKDTQTLGNLFTLASVSGPVPQFKGPVDVILGENDFVFCGGNCTYPSDQTIPTLDLLYPSAGNGSQHFIVPGAGHAINGHYSAPKAFEHINGFLDSNGF